MERAGPWVTYLDYKNICRQLDEAQQVLAAVMTQAIKKEMRVSLLSLGCCPECGRKVYNYTAPTSGDYEWIRKQGVDPTTNHRNWLFAWFDVTVKDIMSTRWQIAAKLS